jgi:hypothetical protein
MGQSLNRRAAFTGAIVSAAALAMPVAAAVRPSNLQGLVDKLRDDAQAIDPTITKVWVYYDELMGGPRGNRVSQLYFERDGAPFKRAALAADKVDNLQADLRAALHRDRGGEWMICAVRRDGPVDTEWFGVPEGYGLNKDGTPV